MAYLKLTWKGLYLVLVLEPNSVYWDDLIYEIRRGLWFEVRGHTFIPCPGNLSNQIEDGYNRYLSDKSRDRWALLGPHLNNSILYSDDYTAWMQSELLSGKLTRVVSQGVKLLRGYDQVQRYMAQKLSRRSFTGELLAESIKESSAVHESITDESERQITHLILVIHGIGQKLAGTLEKFSIVNDCNMLRESIRNSSKHVKFSGMPKHGGVQVLPIQWRQNLSFSMNNDDLKDHEKAKLTLEDINLEGVPGIRMIASDSILDVLLYMTPNYRQDMISQVTKECNRVYKLFMEKNPKFSGKISIYGHSLGSVIVHDILCHKGPMSEPATPKKHEVDIADILLSGNRSSSIQGLFQMDQNIMYQPFEFEVDQFFCVGSPLGLFMLLEGNRLLPRDSEVPANGVNICRPSVNAIYNLFHPYDPICYRLEPLFAKRLASIKPLPIPYTKGGITSVTNSFANLRKNLFTGIISPTSSSTSSTSPTKEKSPTEPPSDMDKWLQMLNPNSRLDFCIQEGLLENPYLSSFGVHVSYWSDQDVNVLILKAIHGILLY